MDYSDGEVALPECHIVKRKDMKLFCFFLDVFIAGCRSATVVLVRLAHVLLVSLGDQEAIHAFLDEGLGLYTELGDKDGIAYTHYLSGWLALNQGNINTAHLLLQDSFMIYRDIGNRRNLAESLALLARIVAAQGESTSSRELYEESLTIASEMNHKWLIASCLEGLASVVATQGEFRWSAQLWGAAEALRENITIAIPPVEQEDYEHSIAYARIQSGEESFTIAWNTHGLRNEIHNKQYSMNGRHEPFHHASSGCLQLLGRGCKPMR
jgi:tetratricopeptide (TPR) repeat protein